MKKLFQFSNPIIVFFIVILFCSSSCINAHKSGQPDDGNIQKGVYLNTYFGLSFPIPDGWHILDDKNQEILRQEAIKQAVENDPTVKETIQDEQKTTWHLLSVFQYPMGTTPTNASIMIIAEKIPQGTNIASGRDYSIQSAQSLAKHPLYKQVSKVYDYSIGENAFSRVDFELGSQAVAGYQSNITMIRKGYAFSFVLVASTQEGLTQLEQVLGQTKFEPIDDIVNSSKTTSNAQETRSISGIVGLFLIIGGFLLYLSDRWLKKRKESK